LITFFWEGGLWELLCFSIFIVSCVVSRFIRVLFIQSSSQACYKEDMNDEIFEDFNAGVPEVRLFASIRTGLVSGAWKFRKV
jgi:hypothetical protein